MRDKKHFSTFGVKGLVSFSVFILKWQHIYIHRYRYTFKDILLDIFIYISSSIYQYFFLYIYMPPFLKSTEARTPHTTSECVRKVSASGARFCRQYKRNCRANTLWIQSGRERGLPGLLWIFLFSGYHICVIEVHGLFKVRLQKARAFLCVFFHSVKEVQNVF